MCCLTLATAEANKAIIFTDTHTRNVCCAHCETVTPADQTCSNHRHLRGELATFSTEIMISLFRIYKRNNANISILSNFILRMTNMDFAVMLQKIFACVQYLLFPDCLQD